LIYIPYWNQKPSKKL